ncbi:HEPN domain-containing protein [Metapseudomonas otitidis]|uniref:HEPN domain-containing protein n=1 Tax=Metapseudomonas otitidis TaxID=319939 RepID=UPI001EECCD97|nr:HEPN domain-containing protein [Pseudomonas otitidis]
MGRTMSANNSYHFPVLFLTPCFEEPELDLGHFALSKRKWQTSTFDLATLATRHKLHLPYQAMDIFLVHCNLEVRVSAVATVEEAQRKFRALQIALYRAGISPFLSPFITTHSINAYSGINSRDSGLSLDKLPEEMRTGIKSGEDLVEVWPLELSFDCRTINDKRDVSDNVFYDAAKFAEEWLRVAEKNSPLHALESAMTDAPKLSSRAQSILHIWSALESIFPRVTTEASFRVALYMAQLNSNGRDRRDYHKRVKRAYDLRSKIAHGAKSDPGLSDWLEAWSLLTDSVSAIVRRGGLPSEDALLEELLA